MSLQLSSRQAAELRDDVLQLVQRARGHEIDLAALVASAQTSIRHAEAALSRTRDLHVDELKNVLDAQWERSIAAADRARTLCVEAREQHDAACRLLARLDGNTTAAQAGIQDGLCRDAVLVVDDFYDVREVVALALQNSGYIVRTAADGLEGLIAAYMMRPAVIIMDVTMPVLDGIEATRLIRAAKSTREARVIAHTGQADTSWDQRLFDAVLQKPATLDAVVAAVQQVVAH